MISADTAIENAARILERAEIDPNPQLMERFDALACSWLALANLLMERERV